MREPVTLFYNGTIHTLNSEQPRASALAVRGERILAVGTQGRVQAAAAGAPLTAINLRGRAMIPGLTDAHVHITWYGLARLQVELGTAHSRAAALQLVAAHAAQLPADAWVEGGGWHQSEWQDSTDFPTRADLDQVCPDKPVFLVRKDGHSAWVNSRALELAGITAATPDPADGAIARAADGEPTGILLETAQDLIRAVIGEPPQARRVHALEQALHEALSYGITSLHIPAGPRALDAPETMRDLHTLHQQGRLPLRCLTYVSHRELEPLIALGLQSGWGDVWLRLGGLKLFADGSLGSQTAALLQPYEGSTERGMALYDDATLTDLITRANLHGIAVAVHAIGDAANRSVLTALTHATAQRAHHEPPLPPLALPNRIEHVQLIDPADLPRLAHLGVLASMQPLHATSDMHMADALWGPRCQHAYALRSVWQSGATVLLGSDAPIETLNPWHGIHAAVTRQRPTGSPPDGWYPAQRLSIHQALLGYCVNPAIASGEAHLKGMLKPGMLADLVVLSADPFQCAPNDLHLIQADLTMVGGQVRWQRT